MRINLDCVNHEIFQNKKEWDDYLAPMIKTPKKVYSPQPCDVYPDQFPCLMIYTDSVIYRSDGNDEFPNFFIYDFEEEKN